MSKVAIVTGGSSGIGLELVKRLLARDYHVISVARRASAIADASVKIDGDVGSEATAARAVQAALERFGRLDLFVNNAGIFIAKPFTEYNAEEYAQLLSTNLHGFVYSTQHALRAMVPRASGHIVNIGTSLSVQPNAAVPSALAILIKGGIEAASRSLAIEYAKQGIRVNTVAPGIIDTPMHAQESHPFLRQLSPAARLGSPADVADAVLYLDNAPFVSGEIVHVDGGAHAGKW
jgi:NAD(P)-dependent dehydrogenase (short-subunit alcohol dehydrogenase family)